MRLESTDLLRSGELQFETESVAGRIRPRARGRKGGASGEGHASGEGNSAPPSDPRREAPDPLRIRGFSRRRSSCAPQVATLRVTRAMAVATTATAAATETWRVV